MNAAPEFSLFQWGIILRAMKKHIDRQRSSMLRQRKRTGNAFPDSSSIMEAGANSEVYEKIFNYLSEAKRSERQRVGKGR